MIENHIQTEKYPNTPANAEGDKVIKVLLS